MLQIVAQLRTPSSTGDYRSLDHVSDALKQLQELNPERAAQFMKNATLTPNMRVTFNLPPFVLSVYIPHLI